MSLEAQILDSNYVGNTMYNCSISPGWQKREQKQPERIFKKKKSPKITWTIQQIDNFLDHNLCMYQEVILQKYNTVFFRKVFAKEEITSVLVKIFLVKCIIKEMGSFVSKKLFAYEIFPEKIIFSCSDEVYDTLQYARENLF